MINTIEELENELLTNTKNIKINSVELLKQLVILNNPKNIKNSYHHASISPLDDMNIKEEKVIAYLYNHTHKKNYNIILKGKYYSIVEYVYADKLFEEYQRKEEEEKYYNYEHLTPIIDQNKEYVDLFNQHISDNLKEIHKYTNNEFCFIFTSSAILSILPEKRLKYLFGCLDCGKNLAYTQLMLKNKNTEKYHKPFLFKVYDKKNRPDEMFEINMLDNKPGVIKSQDIL